MSITRKTLLVLAVIFLVYSPVALAWAPKESALYKTITVVSTNDFHGALVGSVHSWSHGDVVGGAEWLAGYINIIWEENPGGVLLLDGGDIMQGTLISNYFDGASTIEVFNEMGYDAAAIGNHEFDWGQEVLADREHQAHFPFLAANIFYTGTDERPDWATPYVIKPMKGIKVGIIGVANPETPLITNPTQVANLDFTDPGEAVNELVDDVEAEGATIIIVLAHIGGYWPYLVEISDLADALDPEKVDLIVSGHTHSRIDDVINGIPVIQAYSSGTAFARVDFTVDKRTGEVFEYEMNPYPTTTYQTYYGAPAIYNDVVVVPDPEVEVTVNYYEEQIEEVKNEVLGETTAPIWRNYRYESAMGDWVTDIMRGYDSSINFALTNSGGLRVDIDSGQITFGEIFEVLPFDNTLVKCTMTGAQVVEALEQGITGAHGVVQVSGLEFTFNYDAPMGARIVGNVIDLSTGLPIVPTSTYIVAVNDFMAAGGDEYFVLPTVLQENTYVLVRDIVVDWIRANSPFAPPDPAVEQRMTALGTPPP